MRVLFLLVFFSVGFLFAQPTVDTKAIQVTFSYPDSTKDITYQCNYTIHIGIDTITIAHDPLYTLIVHSRLIPYEAYGGTVLEMLTKDDEGIGCKTILFVTDKQKELIVKYTDLIIHYIIE